MNKARAEAKRNGIEIISNTPCLEKLLLAIAEETPRTFGGSAEYKREFESRYIERKKRGDNREYERIFPKELLDTRRKSIPELDALIQIMER